MTPPDPPAAGAPPPWAPARPRGARLGRARRYLRALLAIAVSGLLLAWILHMADVGQVAARLRAVPLVAVAAALLINYLGIPLRVVQWRWLLGNRREPSFFVTLRALCLGYLGNSLLPMRGGELLRAYVLSRAAAIAFPTSLTSVVLARLQDLPPILMLSGFVLWLLSFPAGTPTDSQPLLGNLAFLSDGRIEAAFRALALCTLLAALALVVAYCARNLLRRHFSRLPERIAQLFARFMEGLDVVGSPRLFWGSQGLAYACWALYTAAPVPLLMGFGLDFRHACLAALAQNGLATFAHLLPSAPGAIGTFHALCLVAIGLTNPGMDRDAAIAYTVIAHLIGAVSPALPGLLFLPGTWSDVRAVRNKEVADPGGPPER